MDVRLVEHVIIDAFSHNAILQHLSGKIDDNFDFSLEIPVCDVWNILN